MDELQQGTRFLPQGLPSQDLSVVDVCCSINVLPLSLHRGSPVAVPQFDWLRTTLQSLYEKLRAVGGNVHFLSPECDFPAGQLTVWCWVHLTWAF